MLLTMEPDSLIEVSTLTKGGALDGALAKNKNNHHHDNGNKSLC